MARSPSRPGEYKIGVTGLDPYDRLDRYERKYQEDMLLMWDEWIERPYEIEKQLANRLKFHRGAALTIDESNEWYEIEFDELVEVISTTISSR